MLFERGDSLRFGDSLTGQREVIADLLRPNSLFLSAAAANNHKWLSVVHRWFTAVQQHEPTRLGHRTPPPETHHIDEQMLELLKYADLGISGARMVKAIAKTEPRDWCARAGAPPDQAGPVVTRRRAP